MSTSNRDLDNRTSSVRDIATLFSREKRFGAKQSDLVSGAALNICLVAVAALTRNSAFKFNFAPAAARLQVSQKRHSSYCMEPFHAHGEVRF